MRLLLVASFAILPFFSFPKASSASQSQPDLTEYAEESVYPRNDQILTITYLTELHHGKPDASRHGFLPSPASNRHDSHRQKIGSRKPARRHDQETGEQNPPRRQRQEIGHRNPTRRVAWDRMQDLLASGSSSYGYGYSADCECTPFDLLGIAAGGATLAALGAFLLSQMINNNNAGGGGGRGRGLGYDPKMAPVWTEVAPPQFRQVIGRWFSEVAPRSRPWTALGDVLGGWSGEKATEVGQRVVEMMCGNSTNSAQARGGSSCDCFAGIVGALAGFAALAALVAFAVMQAANAAGGGGRAFGASKPQTSQSQNATYQGTGGQWLWEADEQGERFVSNMLELLTEDRSDCMSYKLCRLNAKAREAGDPYNTLIQLASLPLSWFLTFTAGGNMNDYCEGIWTSRDYGQCRRKYHLCANDL